MAGWADTKTRAAESFWWIGKTMTGLGASGINDSGQVADACGPDPGMHAWLGSNGTTSAAAISSIGPVAGWAQISTDAGHGFLFGNGKMTDLGLNFFPAVVSDNGVVIRGGPDLQRRDAAEPQQLDPGGSHFQIQYAAAINDHSQTVANAYDTATNQTHALLLTPADNPACGHRMTGDL